jgi:hypothetical protein
MRTKLAGGSAALPLLFTTSATTASDGVDATDVEARLAAAVGDWTIPGKEATNREVCEWQGNERSSSATRRAPTAHRASASSATRRDDTFTCWREGHRADTGQDIGFPSGQNGIAWTSESRTTAGVMRMTTVTTPLADGRIHVRQERSENGGPWTEPENFHYIPRETMDTRSRRTWAPWCSADRHPHGIGFRIVAGWNSGFRPERQRKHPVARLCQDCVPSAPHHREAPRLQALRPRPRGTPRARGRCKRDCGRRGRCRRG